uniref:Uncharacterized protein n=1 Tax=Craspedostauros australis TaxID=1486917 RepID=A0A7R9WUM3_9STRA
MNERKFVVGAGADEEGDWREATKQERIDFVGKVFNYEKQRHNADKGGPSKSSKLKSPSAKKGKLKTVNERRRAKDVNSSFDRDVSTDEDEGFYDDDHDHDGHDDDADYEAVEPGRLDICMGVPDHPGTNAFYRVLKSFIKKHQPPTYTMEVYEAMKKKIYTSRMLTALDAENWRLATNEECIDFVGDCFAEVTEGNQP